MKLSRNKARVKKHLRIRTKISGTAERPRLNVYKSLKQFEAQLIDDVKGHTLTHSSTIKLKIENGGNVAAATTIGEAMGDAIIALGIKQVVFDRGGYIYHGRVKAFADAVKSKGVQI